MILLPSETQNQVPCLLEKPSVQCSLLYAPLHLFTCTVFFPFPGMIHTFRSHTLSCSALGCSLLSSFSFKKMQSFKKMLHLHCPNLDANGHSKERVGYFVLEHPCADSIPEIFLVVGLQTVSQTGMLHCSSTRLSWRYSENQRSPGFHCASCWPAQS